MTVEVEASDRIVTSKDNNPPPLTPLEEAKETISSLLLEGGNWFDGAPIENQEQADCVAKLLDDARKASKKFDADRKTEKKPHDDAGKAVDALWKPIIADADRIVECAKKAQTPWLIKLDEEKRAKEEAARKEAEAKAAELRRLNEENDGSLAAAKARDDAIEEAKKAEAFANRAARETANAKGAGMARAIGLRTYYRAEVQDRRALLNHIAKLFPADLTAFLDEWAQRSVSGGSRSLPGVIVHEERRAA